MGHLRILYITCSLLCTLAYGNIPLIKNVNVTPTTIKITASETLSRYLMPEFFVKYETSCMGIPINLQKLDETIITIPFIMHVMPVIWASGKHFTISTMDEDLFHALNQIQKVFRIFYPTSVWDGTLTPLRLVKNRPMLPTTIPQEAVGILFSGGLDAICTTLRHSDKLQLLITICPENIGTDNSKMLNHIQKEARSFADSCSAHNTFIFSNFFTYVKYKEAQTLVPGLSK